MKKLLNFIATIALLSVANSAFCQSAGGTVSYLSGGNIVAAWVTVDNVGNTTIVGATGTVSEAPTSWNETTVSASLSSTNNNSPAIYANSNGDVLVLWEYINPNDSNAYIGAAVLPSGGSSWTVAQVSLNTEYAGIFDQYASIDSDGNMLVTWSSYNESFTEQTARGATSTVSGSSSWSTFDIYP